jgi:hypothetical protein
LEAQAGAAPYGQVVYPAVFSPPCDSYGPTPDYAATKHTYFEGHEVLNATYVSMTFAPLVASQRGKTPYTIALFKNITNQPIFAAQNGFCDNQIKLWNATNTSPRWVKAVKVDAWVPPTSSKVNRYARNGVYGVQAFTPFIENNLIPCDQLKGYHGSGPGDSSMWDEAACDGLHC